MTGEATGSGLLQIGRIVKPHGLRGEVVVELVTNRQERVAPGSVLVSDFGPLEVRRSRPFEATGDGRWLVTFAGVVDLPGARALRGAVLRAAPLEDGDALWVHLLIGADVADADGMIMGQVVAVEANPASDLLVLDDGGLVPLRFVTELRPGLVVVDVPPGLLQL